MSDQWGPWIEHDGKGCPCVGMWVEAVCECQPGVFTVAEGITGSFGGESWHWENWCKPSAYWRCLCARVIRYRIRKPRGLTILESLLHDLPEGVDA